MSRPRLLLVVTCCLVLWALPGLAAAGPKIVFDSTEALLGKVKEGTTVNAEYSFRNTGDQNLVIDRISPSCGCTAPTYDKVVKPGEKGKVILELDTTGITGSFRKTAVVATNDMSKPFVTLLILGDTQASLVVDGGNRLELNGCLGQPVTATAIIRHPEGKPAFVSGVENPMEEYLEAKLKPVPGGRQYQLILTSKVKEPTNFAGPIFLTVPNSSKVSVYVVADIKGAYAIQPHEVYFGGFGKEGPSPTRGVLLQRACADKLTLDQVKVNREHFDVKPIWQVPGEKLYLEITPRLDYLPKGPFSEGLAVVASGEEFKVRLSGVVR